MAELAVLSTVLGYCDLYLVEAKLSEWEYDGGVLDTASFVGLDEGLPASGMAVVESGPADHTYWRAEEEVAGLGHLPDAYSNQAMTHSEWELVREELK